MLPLVIMIATTGTVRALGRIAHVEALDSWAAATAVGMALMLLVMASAHFVPARRALLVEMVPPALGRPAWWVTLTGLLEVAGALGLLVPVTRSLAAVCVAVLLVAMFPANVRAAREGVGITSVRLPTRALIQVLFVLACAVVA
ncbi:DoxX family protein [Nocardioides sp.]|uniref:DoxX family protein n=1 Tax=Nocardioides sp. TaxID=35761 RepID=UPI002ED7ED38